jgi:hypothetical protein
MEITASLPRVRLVGFTGRQELLHPPEIARIIGEKLGALATGGERLLACASLTGEADLLFAREALRLKLPLWLLLPAAKETVIERLPEAMRAEARAVLAEAAQADVLETDPGPELPLTLGCRLAERSDLLLVVTRKGAETQLAEMEQVIAHASTRSRPVFAIEEFPDRVGTREISVEPEKALPDIDLEKVSPSDLFGDIPPPASPPGELVAYFEACDADATQRAPRVRKYLLNIVVANATAALAGAVTTAFRMPPPFFTLLNVLKFVCVLTGLIIYVVLRRRESENRWLIVRLKAEVCRSALATWRSPRMIGLASAEQIPELRALVQSIHYFRALHRPARAPTLQEFKADYGARRLLDQAKYFHKHATRARRISGRFGPAYIILIALSLLTATGAVVYQSVLGFPLRPGTLVNFFFQFIPAIGPALASWVMAFQAIESVGRRQARFREMEHWMRQAMEDLKRCRTWKATYELVEWAEKMLLNEVTEWYVVSKYGK